MSRAYRTGANRGKVLARFGQFRIDPSDPANGSGNYDILLRLGLRRGPPGMSMGRPRFWQGRNEVTVRHLQESSEISKSLKT